ncbi:MAG: hypothetical protein U0768_15110 [Anaerolineae bacterium]
MPGLIGGGIVPRQLPVGVINEQEVVAPDRLTKLARQNGLVYSVGSREIAQVEVGHRREVARRDAGQHAQRAVRRIVDQDIVGPVAVKVANDGVLVGRNERRLSKHHQSSVRSRVWLVDWEAAFLNDPYVDLAVAANFFVEDDAQAEAYLRAYFGEPAGDYRRARFYLMQQAMHVFYVAFLMLIVAQSGISVGSDMTAPDFRDFHARLISGEVALVTPEERLAYARVHLNAVLANMRTQRFRDAVALVAAARATE